MVSLVKRLRNAILSVFNNALLKLQHHARVSDISCRLYTIRANATSRAKPVEAFKRALLDAKSIAYLRVGSGIYIAGLVERLGIADAIKSKVTRPETDVVSERVAKGEVELGLVVITQILTTAGVDFVGHFPRKYSHIACSQPASARIRGNRTQRSI